MTKAKRILLHTVFERIWHVVHAVSFLVLIVTGLFIHYADSIFDTGLVLIVNKTHHYFGLLVSLFYLLYVVYQLLSGRIKYYLPNIKTLIPDLIKQAKYYGYGIFIKAEHPFHIDEKRKFNPLQQVTYLSIMFSLVPFQIITGIILLYAKEFPNIINLFGGYYFVGVVHSFVTFFISAFMIGHLYLATTGETVSEYFNEMKTGYKEIE
jgi:thiosulfate reductase cytochrome b subunit